MAFISVYITHPNKETAGNITGELLNQKLIACANIFPMESAYWWKEEIVREGEWVSIVKTVPEHWAKLVQIIEEKHPYEVPCIMRFDVSANPAYEAWIYRETNSTNTTQ